METVERLQALDALVIEHILPGLNLPTATADVDGPSNIYGFGLPVDEQPSPVDVNTDALFESFMTGFENFGEL
jgi:hypothetical protein